MKKLVNYFFSLFFLFFTNQAFSSDCLENKKYSNQHKCFWLKKVVGIKTPIMIASGTIIHDNFIVTNKHVVEDHPYVIIKFYNGEIRKAYPLPNNFPVDLAILSFKKKDNVKKINLSIPSVLPTEIRVVGYDQGRKKSRIYKKGKLIHFPIFSESISSRIHTDAQSLPGNSGGAVINKKNKLIGFLASGDGNYNEVIPIQSLKHVIDNTDMNLMDNFLKEGKNIRLCADTLEFSYKFQKKPPDQLINKIENICLLSNNKQLFDQVGQTFGRWGLFDKSLFFLNKSLTLDPYSPNTLLSLAISFHIKRDIVSEKPIILKLLTLIPQDPQVLRLGIQVAGYLKDEKMGKNVLNLMKKYNPGALPLAKKYLENALK